jgi:hypothetical protein
MSILRKILSGMLLAVTLTGPVAATAAAIPSRHSTSRSHKANKRPKTVHVRSYTKKNGTHVKAHNRAAPEPK